jgi:serine/threonine protein kinase
VPCADAARIVRDILRTIAQCHSRGVIVRDVKPENFLFKDARPDAPLRAIDFGLAEYCKPGEHLTDKVSFANFLFVSSKASTAGQCKGRMSSKRRNEACDVSRRPDLDPEPKPGFKSPA